MKSRNQREGFYCGKLRLFKYTRNKTVVIKVRQHVRTGSANKLCGLKFGGKDGSVKIT